MTNPIRAALEAAAFIEVEAGVRYWEDATVNGTEDEHGALIPGRDGDAWRAKINLAEGLIADWPAGTVADIHYKVCDDGRYWLLDVAGARIAKWRGHYVPDDFLAISERGFSDYIIMTVHSDGRIAGWKRPEIDPAEWALIEACDA